MSWVNDFLQGMEPVKRTVKWDGQERDGYFRRISAAERQQLLAGQHVAHKGGQSEVNIDLGANERTKQQMVYFCTVNQDGSQAFDSLKAVSKAPGGLINALFKHASEVNRDESEEDLGKD